MLNESVFDHAALKFVFLAGGPGSGKSHIANDLFGFDGNFSFGTSGMKLYNPDMIFERALEKLGYDKDLTKLPPEEFDKLTSQSPTSLRQRCRELAKRQMKKWVDEGLGIVFDGTGNIAWSYEDKKNSMEDVGYDTYLIWVDTPLETALKRNAQRERKLPEDIVKRLHNAVQANKAQFEKMFGDDMIVVNNDDGEGVTDALRNKINKIISAPVKNPLGQHFLNTGERKKRTYTPKHITQHKDTTTFRYPGSSDWGMGGNWRTEKQGDLFPAGQSSTLAHPKYQSQPRGIDPFDEYWVGGAEPYKQEENPFLARFKQAQTAKQLAQGGKPVAPHPKEKNGDEEDTSLSQQRIYNPETGNNILVKTAMGYPPGHPMRKAAEKFRKQGV